MKEWLNAKTFEYKQAALIPSGGYWIEIPEGAEIAIKFINNPDEHGIVFYKNSGKSCMGKGDNNWQHDSEWTMDQLLNENYHDGKIDLSHDILWQRATHPEELPFIDDEPKSLNDQYAEIEQVRQQTIEATLAERGSRYGDFESVAGTTRALMRTLADADRFDELSAAQYEALHMICSKMARIVNGDPDYTDNWHDIAGYAKLVEDTI